MALELTSGPNSPALALGVLSVALAAKHYVVDFVLQSDWMARGKERTHGWSGPLAVHAGLHGLGMLLIVLLARPELWWLAPADLVIHAGIDRGKALASLRLRWPVSDPRFWWLMGFDQFLHQVTNVVLGTLIIVL
jgi:hypothetical protein